MKRITYLLIMVFYMLLTPMVNTVLRPSFVIAQEEECSEQRLRDLGVMVVECEPSEYYCDNAGTYLLGSDNTEKAFNYFLDKGLTKNQSAGILGNMIRESGVNPERIQNGAEKSTSQDPNDAGGLGWGIIQWTPGNRIFGLLKEADIPVVENGDTFTVGSERHVYDLDVQLDMVWWHLNERTPTGRQNVLPDFKATVTVEEATEFFEDKVEGAGVVALESRIAFAKQTLTLYGNNDSTVAAGTTSGACVSVSSLNDDFIVYSQYDPRWKDLPYASSTIGQSGCGPSAMAMIVTALTGKDVTPVDTAEIAAASGLYVPGAGSSWAIGPELAEHYQLNHEPIAAEIDDISAALKAGKMIITSGKGALPFSTGGHYIVIRGITASGDWLIGDSGHSGTSDQIWNPTDIIIQMKEREGSAYAIWN